MSLNKFTNIERNKPLNLKIACETLECLNCVCDSMSFPSGGDLNAHDINVSNNLKVATSNGDINYSTPDKGQPNYSLHTDGAGNTFWSPDDTGSADLTYNGAIPVALGQHVKFSNTDTSTVNESKLIESPTDLNLQGLNLTNVGLINGDVLPDITDLNNKTQNINLSDTAPGLTKFDGRVNSDFAFSDSGFDHVIYGSDVSSFNPTVFVDNTVFGSQCGYDLGSDNTNIGYSAGAINTGEKNTNLGSQAGGESVAVGQGSNTVCIGFQSGGGNLDGSVCVGSQAGNRCGVNSVSLGKRAGANNQSAGAIAIGGLSSESNQGTGSISIGENACNVGQGIGSIAIGQNACSTSAQGASSVAIGNLSALTNQGANAIAIGALSAQTNQDAKTIVLNADTSGLNTTQENEIRMKAGLSTLDLNQTSGLVVNGQNFTTKISDLESKTQNIDLATTVAGETHVNNKLFIDGELITEDSEIHLGQNVYANNQTASEIVLIGRNAGSAGVSNSVIAIGSGACKNGAATLSTTVGRLAGELAPPNIGSVVIGNSTARQSTAGVCSVVIGCEAQNALALTNGQKYVCIGNQAGRSGIGNGSVVIGDRAGEGLAVPQNSIVIAAKLNSGATVASSNEMKFVAGSNEFNYNGTDINFTNTITTSKGNLNIASINNLTPAGGSFSQTSSVVIADTTTESTIIGSGQGSLSVPADKFRLAGSYRVSAGGVMSCLNNTDLTIRLYGGSTGSTLLGTIPTITVPTSTGKWWGIEFYFTIRALGGAGVASFSFRGKYEQNVDSQNALIGQSVHSIENTNFDTTILNTLNITAQWGAASPSNTFTTTQCVLYVIY